MNKEELELRKWNEKEWDDVEWSEEKWIEMS